MTGTGVWANRVGQPGAERGVGACNANRNRTSDTRARRSIRPRVVPRTPRKKLNKTPLEKLAPSRVVCDKSASIEKRTQTATVGWHEFTVSSISAVYLRESDTVDTANEKGSLQSHPIMRAGGDEDSEEDDDDDLQNEKFRAFDDVVLRVRARMASVWDNPDALLLLPPDNALRVLCVRVTKNAWFAGAVLAVSGTS